MSDNPQATASLTDWMRTQEEINKEVAIQLNRLDIELEFMKAQEETKARKQNNIMSETTTTALQQVLKEYNYPYKLDCTTRWITDNNGNEMIYIADSRAVVIKIIGDAMVNFLNSQRP